MAATRYPQALQHIMSFFGRLPGVGRRTAERLTLAMMAWPEEQIEQFGQALVELKKKVRPCASCGNYAEGELCAICQDPERERGVLCVVEQASQIIVLENSGSYKGLYHVLGGKLSPLSGKGPEALRIKELAARLRQGDISEMIIAISPDVEGEATAHFLAQEFAALPMTITRIASGVPVGADLNFADAATIAMALSGRHQL
ncbi:MAG: recombination mediator RecR [Lentisphaeria bacterium]|jgi:recombination protein RecR